MKVARWIGIWILFGAMSVGASGEPLDDQDPYFMAQTNETEMGQTEESVSTPPAARGAAITLFGGIASFPESNVLTNRWLFGLALESMLVEGIAFELEGSLGENRYRTLFGSNQSYQYNGGATLKWVPRVGPVIFELGAGGLFSYYDDLVTEDIFNRDRWTLSARIMGGLGWYLSEDLLLGVRLDALFPFAVPRRNSVVVSPADSAVRRTQLRVLGGLTWEL